MKIQFLKKAITDIKNFSLFITSDTLSRIKKTNVKKNTILLIRVDAIGDFVLWTTAAKEFRRLYPTDKYKITLLANKTWADLAKSISYWDDIWILDRERFTRDPVHRFTMLREVRNAGFEIVIQPTFSREFFIGDAIVRASGAKVRIGSIGDCSNIEPYQKRISDQWYTLLVPASKSSLMELKRNAEFMRGLGLHDFKADLPELFPGGMDCPSIPKNYYVIFPGAMLGKRMWPVERFALLASEIYKKTGLAGIVCGGLGEEKIGQRLVAICNVPLINLVGETTLKQLAAIIKDAHFLVGNETSAVHIAVAVSVPSVCILGGGKFGRFMPYDIEVSTNRSLPRAAMHQMDCFGCNWKCIYPHRKNETAPCISEIKVEDVLKEIEDILKLRKN